MDPTFQPDCLSMSELVLASTEVVPIAACQSSASDYTMVDSVYHSC